MTPGIDFGAAVQATDLQALIQADLGPPDRSRKWRCPFHDDHDPSLSVAPDGRRWKCWSCGASGSAIDWLMRRDGLSVVEAARRLDPATVPASPRPRSSPPPPGSAKVEKHQRPVPVWRDAKWQRLVDALIDQAEDLLWSSEGDEAREWLHRRGFEEHTISRFRLGFFSETTRTAPVEVLGSDRSGRPRRLVAERGITIPRLAPGSWFPTCDDPPGPRWSGIKIRRLMPNVFESWDKAEGPKFRAITGTDPGSLYPHADLVPGIPTLIAEGELDALLAFQQVGHIVNVVTTSGATQGTDDASMEILRRSSAILISTDFDQAGEKAAVAWRGRFPSLAKRLFLPSGKDLTDFHIEGGNLRSWLASELKRLGIKT